MHEIVIPAGSTQPPVEEYLTSIVGVLDLTGASARFLMRRGSDDQIVLDSSATVANAASALLKYQWSSSETDVQGQYYGWWKITLQDGSVYQSDEFPIKIDAHEPGVGADTGDIADQVRQLMPMTFDALSKDNRYGDRMLQTRIDYVKYKLFSTVVAPLAEASTYNPLLRDFVAKNSALQIIPAGIEYWMEQHTSVVTSGTSEAVTYPDRINSLQKLQEWLIREVQTLAPMFTGEFTVRNKGRGPKIANGPDLITPNPQEWGAPFSTGIPRNLPFGPAW